MNEFNAVRVRFLFRLMPAIAIVLAAGGTRLEASTADPANLSWARIQAAAVTDAPASPVARPARNPRAAAPVPANGIARRVADVAARHGVPASLAVAVARVESGLRCNARGRAGELGPLQIKPATARGLGYRGPAAGLNSCEAGLEWGMRHLAAAYRRCGTHAGAAALHNRGLAASCTRTAYSARVTRAMASL
ncbi:transglycosylase SLT domain-containing protein [Phreatobacter sp.]|uniref:transglycosylase SLT domain-containing protein n=1 Tax=Phreatobacter sp. TaxID=1966341 RepID=UPI003F730F2F